MVDRADTASGRHIAHGKLAAGERPDWLIRSASLGIEVSELQAAAAAPGSFSGKGGPGNPHRLLEDKPSFVEIDCVGQTIVTA